MAPSKKKIKLDQSSPESSGHVATTSSTTVGDAMNTEKSHTSSTANQQIEESKFIVDGVRSPIQCIQRGVKSVQPSLIFTHGAGGDCTAAAVVNFMAGFSRVSSVVCFDGAMNLKSRSQAFTAVKEKRPDISALGGRSLGARAATIAADPQHTKALVLASYPLVSPSGDVRDQILLDIDTQIDVLFISGDNDSMCDIKRLNQVRAKMKAKSWLVVVKDGDHGMNVKPKSATTVVGEKTGEIAAEWLQKVPRHHGKPYRMVLRSSKDEAIVGPWSNCLDESTADEKQEEAQEGVSEEVVTEDRTGKPPSPVSRPLRRSKRTK